MQMAASNVGGEITEFTYVADAAGLGDQTVAMPSSAQAGDIAIGYTSGVGGSSTATWNGFTPNELDQRLVERREIIPLAEQNMHLYLAEIIRWGRERVERFRQAGWRKAQGC